MFNRWKKRARLAAMLGISAWATASAVSPLQGVEPHRRAVGSSDGTNAMDVELFQAESDGKIKIEMSAPAADHAFVRIENKTDQLLNIQLPAVFAGVPVLAQFGNVGGQGGGLFGGGQLGGGQAGGMPMGGNFGNNLGGGNLGFGNQGMGNNQGNQGLGGGFGQGNGGGNGIGNFQRNGLGNNGGGNFRVGNPGFGNGLGNPGFGGGMFRVAPGKTGKLPVNTVCLEHGKPDPNSRVKYRLVPLQQFNTDPRVEAVCRKLGSGEISQHTAQCAAWHITDNLSWEELAAKNRFESRYTGNIKFFSEAELSEAMSLVSGLESDAAVLAAQSSKASLSTGASTSSLSAAKTSPSGTATDGTVSSATSLFGE